MILTRKPLRYLLGIAIHCSLAAALSAHADDAENFAKEPRLHPSIYQLERPATPTNPPPQPSPPPPSPTAAVDTAVEIDPPAATLFGSSIFALPADIPASPDQAALRAELTLLRERADRADKLSREGKTDEAIALMLDSKRLTADPKLQAKLLNRVALYFFRLQQYSDALAYANQAWDLAPDDLASQCNLAAALLTTGETALAIEILDRVSERIYLAPRFAFVTYFNLACAHSIQGNPNKAVQNLRRAAYSDASATLTSLGDTQLDAIRDLPEFQKARDDLLRRLLPDQP